LVVIVCKAGAGGAGTGMLLYNIYTGKYDFCHLHCWHRIPIKNPFAI